MDPLPLAPDQWDRVAQLLVDLTAAVGLALSAGFALLLGHVIAPAVADPDADDAESGWRARTVRRALYPIAAVSAIAMLLGLGRAIVTAVEVLGGVYPRLLI
jgi:predicted protein tyrosine phosphatase